MSDDDREIKVDNPRVAAVATRLAADMVDGDGRSPDPARIAEVVEAKASAFEEAPIQDFVPLLAEHQAREELRAEGFHRELPDEPEAAAPGPRAGEAEPPPPNLLPR